MAAVGNCQLALDPKAVMSTQMLKQSCPISECDTLEGGGGVQLCPGVIGAVEEVPAQRLPGRNWPKRPETAGNKTTHAQNGPKRSV